MQKLTVGSCFSGIGGLELGLEWTGGFETKWQIEKDEYASAVLKKHWPDVKRYGDITEVGGAELEPVDVICGGFPCQDVSLAGSRKGLEGKRSTLWGEMFRLVCEVKPRWVVAENVPGLFSSDGGRFFGNILRDLASAGFDVGWGVLSAAGVGAPHLRRRVFIIANSKKSHDRIYSTSPMQGQIQQPGVSSLSSNVADTKVKSIRPGLCESGTRGERRRRSGDSGGEVCESVSKGLEVREGQEGKRTFSSITRTDWWAVEPNVGRVAHGIPSRVDRLRCLGNAVVPQVAQRIGAMILNQESVRQSSARGEEGI